MLRSHADRSRVVTDEYRRMDVPPNGIQPTVVLLDGFTRGTRRIEHVRGTATLTIQPFSQLSGEDAAALTAEGARLLAFDVAGAQATISRSPTRYERATRVSQRSCS